MPILRRGLSVGCFNEMNRRFNDIDRRITNIELTEQGHDYFEKLLVSMKVARK